MPKMLSLDRTDIKILETLQKQARITNQDLANTVNLSPSSCLQRVRRLEQNQVLLSYHARVNLPAICRHLVCIATVSLRNHSLQDFRDFEQLVDTMPEIIECYTVSGEFDFFLKILCPDMQRYLEINEALLSSLDHSVYINTHIVMNQNKHCASVDIQRLREDNE